jgi:hypothetical protein
MDRVAMLVLPLRAQALPVVAGDRDQQAPAGPGLRGAAHGLQGLVGEGDLGVVAPGREARGRHPGAVRVVQVHPEEEGRIELPQRGLDRRCDLGGTALGVVEGGAVPHALVVVVDVEAAVQAVRAVEHHGGDHRRRAVPARLEHGGERRHPRA